MIVSQMTGNYEVAVEYISSRPGKERSLGLRTKESDVKTSAGTEINTEVRMD